MGFHLSKLARLEKTKIACGYWARSNAELVIIAERGRPSKPDMVFTSVFEGQPWAARHSAKPVNLYEDIEKSWPSARKLEWFARTDRQGWECLGAETGHYLSPLKPELTPTQTEGQD